MKKILAVLLLVTSSAAFAQHHGPRHFGHHHHRHWHPHYGWIVPAVIGGAVVYNTAEAITNVTLNIRGNSTTTMDSFLQIGQLITASFIMTNGASFAACADNFQIDGTPVTVKWAGGITPVGSASSVLSVTLTTIKTAASTYTVLGSFTGFF